MRAINNFRLLFTVKKDSMALSPIQKFRCSGFPLSYLEKYKTILKAVGFIFSYTILELVVSPFLQYQETLESADVKNYLRSSTNEGLNAMANSNIMDALAN